MLIDSFIFILSEESNCNKDSTHKTKPDLLRSCLRLQEFRWNFASDFSNLLLVRLHHAGVIIFEASYPMMQQRGLSGC